MLFGLYVCVCVCMLLLLSCFCCTWVAAAAAQACLISMIDISNHLMHFGEPVLQRYMIRIMWMVPIYAVESWLSLRFKDEAIYIETARECCTCHCSWQIAATPMLTCCLPLAGCPLQTKHTSFTRSRIS